MNESIAEVKVFWDDFAQEYTQIQTESQLTLPQDLCAFFLDQQILPTATFLDVAGGSGKYVPFFIPYIKNYTLLDLSAKMLELAANEYACDALTLLEEDQQSFLEHCRTNAYEVVFSAMNPALDDPHQLTELLRIAKNKLCILRLVKETDPLFTPWEKAPREWQWMEHYKKWLDRPFHSQLFCYQTTEKITPSFFRQYFQNDVAKEKLDRQIERLFGDKAFIMNHSKYSFELLSIEAG